jgi:hypothetical protein
MESLIEKLKSVAFSGEDIMLACEDKTKIVLNSDIHKYHSIDELFGDLDSVVILYETKPHYGHWVCLIRHPNNLIEFFDSYGMFVDDELNYINPKFRKQSHQDYRYLSKLILESGYRLIYNKVKLQKVKNDVSSCGRHVCLRIIMKDIPLKKYIKLLTTNYYDADTIVTFLTSFV